MPKLSLPGKWLMNSPQRALAERYYVAPLLERLGGRIVGDNVLEVGCGCGVGVEIILNRFGASTVHALDFDDRQVALAQRRLLPFDPERINLHVGDAARLAFPDEIFDAVFDFGAIHQIADWPSAVGEVSRVLKPGGRFYFEEIAWVPLRMLMRYFVEEYESLESNPFTAAKFLSELVRRGFEVQGRWVTRRVLSVTTGVVGDLIGVAARL